jgi:single-strand DNA-binding protein
MPNGKPVTNFSLAVTERWKNKDGEQQEHTEWYRCSAFDRTAEIIDEYVRKGDQLLVVGKQRTNEYEDKDGNKRQSVQTIVDRVVLQPKKDRPAEEERSNGQRR